MRSRNKALEKDIEFRLESMKDLVLTTVVESALVSSFYMKKPGANDFRRRGMRIVATGAAGPSSGGRSTSAFCRSIAETSTPLTSTPNVMRRWVESFAFWTKSI